MLMDSVCTESKDSVSAKNDKAFAKNSSALETENEKNRHSTSSSNFPDGGWGWVVVFSSFLCNILVDGIGFSYGVLLPTFSEHFEAPKSKVSLAGSMMLGMYLGFGPIAGGLVNKYGCRIVTILGSIISAIGVLVGAFSPSLDILIVSYGIIGGIGFGMMYLPSVVCVGLYFDKKRPLATGIAVCGSGIGTFIFAPILEILSEIYDWRDVLIILAGVILNGIVCGMLFRPLKLKEKSEDSVRFKKRYPDPSEKINKTSHDKHYNNIKSEEKSPSCKFYLDTLEETEPFIQVSAKTENFEECIRLKHDTKSLNNMSDIGTTWRQPIEMSPNKIRAILSVPQIRYHSFATLTITNSNEQMNAGKVPYHRRCCQLFGCRMDQFNEFFDFSLLLNIPFVLLWLGNILCVCGYVIPFMYVVDRAVLLKISTSNAAWILSIIGITNTIGRVLSGLVGNLKNVNVLLFNNIALLLASLALFLQPLVKVYVLFVVFSVVYGLCIGTYVALSSVILCDLLGVERLASSFGLLGVARGIASVLGPSVAGILFQATGNYDASFCLGGGMFFLGACLHFLIFMPHIRRCTEKQIPNRQNDKVDEQS